jgi:hypothetical protein
MPYAWANTRSDGGIRRMAGLGYRAPIVEVDYPWLPDEVYRYAVATEEFGGGGGGSSVSVPTEQVPTTPALAFNPPQGQVVVVTQPGEPPRVVLNTPGIQIDTSQIGQPATPSAEQTFADLKNWLQSNTIFPSVPNWLVLAGGALAYKLFSERGR